MAPPVALTEQSTAPVSTIVPDVLAAPPAVVAPLMVEPALPADACKAAVTFDEVALPGGRPLAALPRLPAAPARDTLPELDCESVSTPGVLPVTASTRLVLARLPASSPAPPLPSTTDAETTTLPLTDAALAEATPAARSRPGTDARGQPQPTGR